MAISTMMNPFMKTAAAAAVALSIGLIAVKPATAGAPAVVGWTRSSTVTDSVTDNGNGTWAYGYTVNNTSLQNGGDDTEQPIIVDWELPWFGDAGITNILSPINWDWSIETIGVVNAATGWGGVAAWQDPADPFYAGAGSPFTAATQVLHWFNTCWAQPQASGVAPLAATTCEGQFDNAIFPANSLSGFSFVAAFDPVGAPYQASWAFLPVRTGDPAFPLGGIPNSPLAQGIPEPGLLGLLGIGLVALMLGRRRRA